MLKAENFFEYGANTNTVKSKLKYIHEVYKTDLFQISTYFSKKNTRTY